MFLVPPVIPSVPVFVVSASRPTPRSLQISRSFVISRRFAAIVLVLQLAIFQMSRFRLLLVSIVLLQLPLQLLLHRYRHPRKQRRIPVHFGDHIPAQLADRHRNARLHLDLLFVLQVRLKPLPEIRRRLRVSNVQEP